MNRLLNRPVRPIIVWVSALGFRWDCTACPTVCGWADTIAAAADQGLAHLKDCPTAVAALDRLVAAVMAVPEMVPTVAGGAYCVSCVELVHDRNRHIEDHIDAGAMSERGRLQAVAWADLGARAAAL